MSTLESQLQGLINRMQEDADRVVSTWSNIGDALLRHQDNQNAILGEIAAICQQGLGRQQATPVYTHNAPLQGGPIGNGGVPYYGPQGAPFATAQATPPYASNNGYDPQYPQGYPPQPYQQKDSLPDTGIQHVLKNLRRQPV